MRPFSHGGDMEAIITVVFLHVDNIQRLVKDCLKLNFQIGSNKNRDLEEFEIGLLSFSDLVHS
jgi:hypothetical protein